MFLWLAAAFLPSASLYRPWRLILTQWTRRKMRRDEFRQASGYCGAGRKGISLIKNTGFLVCGRAAQRTTFNTVRT